MALLEVFNNCLDLGTYKAVIVIADCFNGLLYLAGYLIGRSYLAYKIIRAFFYILIVRTLIKILIYLSLYSLINFIVSFKLDILYYAFS